MFAFDFIAFPVYGTNGEMTDEDATRNNFDLNSASQVR